MQDEGTTEATTNDRPYVHVPERLADLGFTPSGWDWRPNQRELAEQIANAPTKVVMLEAECGSGKSTIPQAAAIAADAKYHVLIQTINLQEQYLRDFPKLKLIKGRSNYTCNINNRPADVAPCTIGANCDLRGSWRFGEPLLLEGLPECNYFRAKAQAKIADGSIHNYAYWLGETSNMQSTFRKTDWIICDEAHDIEQTLMDAASETLHYADMRALDIERPPQNATGSIPAFLYWLEQSDTNIEDTLGTLHQNINMDAARLGLTRADTDIVEQSGADDTTQTSSVSADSGQARAASTDQVIRKLHAFRRVNSFFQTLLSQTAGNVAEWVIIKGRDEVTIKPIYGKYGFRRIMDAAKSKVVLMSAFLGAELLTQNLGLDPEDVTIIKAPKVFDRSNSKIYYCPIYKYTYKTSDRRYKHLALAIDRFSNYWARDKGLVHVPSVKLRDTIVQNSSKRFKYLAYDGKGTDLTDRRYATKDVAIDKFLNSEGQSILIGQSTSTGLDLPHTIKWQIIPKLWFAPLQDPAIARRKEVDKSFYTHFAICQLVQAAGRVKRTFDDGGPTIILDESFTWFWAANKHLFPDWFRDNLVYKGWDEFRGIYDGVQKDKMRCNILD